MKGIAKRNTHEYSRRWQKLALATDAVFPIWRSTNVCKLLLFKKSTKREKEGIEIKKREKIVSLSLSFLLLVFQFFFFAIILTNMDDDSLKSHFPIKGSESEQSQGNIAKKLGEEKKKNFWLLSNWVV